MATKKSKDVVWIGKDKKEYTLEDLDNKDLYCICMYLSHGGGWKWFMKDKSKRQQIFTEAKKRYKDLKLTLLSIKRYEKECERMYDVVLKDKLNDNDVLYNEETFYYFDKDKLKGDDIKCQKK